MAIRLDHSTVPPGGGTWCIFVGGGRTYDEADRNWRSRRPVTAVDAGAGPAAEGDRSPRGRSGRRRRGEAGCDGPTLPACGAPGRCHLRLDLDHAARRGTARDRRRYYHHPPRHGRRQGGGRTDRAGARRAGTGDDRSRRLCHGAAHHSGGGRDRPTDGAALPERSSAQFHEPSRAGRTGADRPVPPFAHRGNLRHPHQHAPPGGRCLQSHRRGGAGSLLWTESPVVDVRGAGRRHQYGAADRGRSRLASPTPGTGAVRRRTPPAAGHAAERVSVLLLLS